MDSLKGGRPRSVAGKEGEPEVGTGAAPSSESSCARPCWPWARAPPRERFPGPRSSRSPHAPEWRCCTRPPLTADASVPPDCPIQSCPCPRSAPEGQREDRGAQAVCPEPHLPGPPRTPEFENLKWGSAPAPKGTLATVAGCSHQSGRSIPLAHETLLAALLSGRTPQSTSLAYREEQ